MFLFTTFFLLLLLHAFGTLAFTPQQVVPSQACCPIIQNVLMRRGVNMNAHGFHGAPPSLSLSATSQNETMRPVHGKQEQDRRQVLLTSARRALLVLLVGGEQGRVLQPVHAADDDPTATVHKVDYPVEGKCGQAEVPERVAGLVKSFGGFKDGSCATEGYSTAEGMANGTGDKDQERVYSIYGS